MLDTLHSNSVGTDASLMTLSIYNHYAFIMVSLTHAHSSLNGTTDHIVSSTDHLHCCWYVGTVVSMSKIEKHNDHTNLSKIFVLDRSYPLFFRRSREECFVLIWQYLTYTESTKHYEHLLFPWHRLTRWIQMITYGLLLISLLKSISIRVDEWEETG